MCKESLVGKWFYFGIHPDNFQGPFQVCRETEHNLWYEANGKQGRLDKRRLWAHEFYASREEAVATIDKAFQDLADLGEAILRQLHSGETYTDKSPVYLERLMDEYCPVPLLAER